MIEPANTKFINGLYRTKRYGKWIPFRVGIADVELPDHEVRNRVKFQIRRADDLGKGTPIVELKYL